MFLGRRILVIEVMGTNPVYTLRALFIIHEVSPPPVLLHGTLY